MITATYSGYVAGGSGISANFGDVAGLRGREFTVDFVVDDSISHVHTYTGENFYESDCSKFSICEGSRSIVTSDAVDGKQAVTARISINGQAIYLNNGSGLADRWYERYDGVQYVRALFSVENNGNVDVNGDFGIGVELGRWDTRSYDGNAYHGYWSHYSSYELPDPSGNNLDGFLRGWSYDLSGNRAEWSIGLDLTRISIPEPSILTTMAMGLVMSGALARRRKKK